MILLYEVLFHFSYMTNKNYTKKQTGITKRNKKPANNIKEINFNR